MTQQYNTKKQKLICRSESQGIRNDKYCIRKQTEINSYNLNMHRRYITRLAVVSRCPRVPKTCATSI